MRVSPLVASPPARTPTVVRLPGRRATAAAVAAISLLSVLVLREPSYDPTAWLIWGRQIAHGTLDTVGGPSWKPLPVLFTTAFAPAGDTLAPMLWLVVARAAGMLALVSAFALARRLSGSVLSGLLAATGLLLASDFVFNTVRGDTEGLLVAAAFAGVLAHLDGRRRLAFGLGVVAALLRPEVWPLLAAYAVVLLRRQRDLRTIALLAAAAVVMPAAWFVPEHIGSGDWWRAATRAQNPAPGSPGQSWFPFLMTFVNGAAILSIPVYAGAIHAVRTAWRTRDRTLLTLAGGATAVMVIVAALAQNGFTGNMRYVTLPAAVLCVLAGIGLPGLAAEVRRRGLIDPALGITGLSVAIAIGVLAWSGFRLVQDEQRYGHQLPALIARAGGERAVRSCRPLSTSPFERQDVAWRLHLPQRAVTTHRRARGTAIALADSRLGRDRRLPVRDRLGGWVLRSSCPRLSGGRSR
jgi:hypothetical protein